MKKNDLISVIVPIYNVEKHLKKCVDSIINQTYKNLEIILVDDGSPDNCGKICDEYAKEDLRIRVIHKENGGLSSARNIGIRMSLGSYLMFVDSDDYIEINMVEFLYNAIASKGVNMSVCKYREISGAYKKREFKEEHSITVSGKEAIEMLFVGSKWNFVIVCNKLYEKDLFRGIQFPEGKYHEDEAVAYKLLYKCDKVSCIPKVLYNYVKRNGSITDEYSLKRLDAVDIFEDRLAFFLENNEERLYALAQRSFAVFTFRQTILLKKYFPDKREIRMVIRRKSYRYFFAAIGNSKLKPGEKIIMFVRMFKILLRRDM